MKKCLVLLCVSFFLCSCWWEKEEGKTNFRKQLLVENRNTVASQLKDTTDILELRESLDYISDTGTGEDFPLLIKALDNKDPFVRNIATRGLKRLSRGYAGGAGDAESWQKWYNENKKMFRKKEEKKLSMREIKAQMYNERGLEAYAKGDYVSAKALFGSCVAQDDVNAAYRNNLGLALLRLNDLNEAQRMFEEAIEMRSKDTTLLGSAQTNLAEVWMIRVNVFHTAWMEAKKDAEDDIARKMKSDRNKALEYVLLHTGYALATEIDLELWDAHYFRGRALRRLGRLDEAMNSMREALRRDMRNPKAHLELSLLYYAMNQPFNAWKEIQWLEASGHQVNPQFKQTVKKVLDSE